MVRSIFTIVVGNVGSKALALVREVLFAAWFGTGETAAAFRIAQTAHLLPTQALVGDALSAGLLPLYRQLRGGDRNAARVLVLIASLYGSIFSLVTTALLYRYPGAVAAFIAPGASPDSLAVASDLLRIMALATPFYVLSGILSYVEAAYGRYGGIAWRPMMLNVGSILGAGLAVALKQDHWLATGLLLSHIVFFAWTLVELRKLDGILPEGRPTPLLVLNVAKRFALNLLPLLGLPLAAQFNVLVERIVSSHLGTDIIPSVDYARFVADTTVQLIAVPLGILTMSVHGGSTNSGQVTSHVRHVTVAVLLLSIPISALIAGNATAIVRLLFARGAFGASAIATTSSILVWMGGCLGATVTAYYLVKALNAQLRNGEALTAIVLGCLASMLVNLLLWPAFGPSTIGMAVAAYSIVVLVYCVSRLGLWSTLLPVAGWIFAGTAAQVAASRVVSAHATYPFDLFANCLVALALWLGLLLVVPRLRDSAAPLLQRVPLLRRLFR